MLHRAYVNCKTVRPVRVPEAVRENGGKREVGPKRRAQVERDDSSQTLLRWRPRACKCSHGIRSISTAYFHLIQARIYLDIITIAFNVSARYVRTRAREYTRTQTRARNMSRLSQL